EAFNGPFWHFGKIKNGTQKLAGLADIKVKLGYNPIDTCSVHAEIYPSLIIPTGYKPRAEFVFEPMIGNGQHFAFGCGGNLDVKFIHEDDQCFKLGTNLEYHYL